MTSPRKNPNNLFDQPDELVEDYDDGDAGCPDGIFCELCNDLDVDDLSDEDVA